MKILGTIVLVVFGLCRSVSAQTPNDWANDTYKESNILGWAVHFNTVLNDHQSLMHESDSLLTYELGKIESVLPASSLKKLKEVQLWVEFKSRNHVPMQYHVSADWLRGHDFNPKKESSIELQAVDYKNTDHDSLPLFWYLATAYVHRELGFNNPLVTAAYEHAKHIDAYASGGSFPFNDPNIYFVAISTAYFGSYASEPFNKKRLKQIDPRGYAMLEKAWQINEN